MKSHTYTFNLILMGFLFWEISPFANLFAQTPGKLAFDSLVVQEQIPLLKDSLSPANMLSIHFVFPSQMYGNIHLLGKIQDEFIKGLFGKEYTNLSPYEALEKFYQKYKEDYLATAADYNKAKAEGLDMESWGNTIQIMRINTIGIHEGILSFCVSIENSMGGIHDSRHINYYNINLTTGKLICESDIFKPGYENKLTDVIINRLLEDNKLSKPKQLIEKGYFNLRRLKPNKNFLISKDGIVYAFNETEIAPYSMGLLKVVIPEDRVSNIMKDTK
jgi:hypothetical protein